MPEGGLPNYGISEVLRALRSAGRISASAYFDALLKLRAANARYLPIEADELKHHLLRAPIGEDGMPETPSLVLLRRYAAACALDRFRLHPPAKDEKGTPVLAEFMWAVETQRAVARALVGLWEEKSMNERDRQIRAEWILNQILTHMPGFAEAHSGLPQPNTREGLTAEIGLLFSLGFMLESPWKRTLTDDLHARARFYHWLGDRLVEPLSRVDPVVVQDLAALLTGDFLKRAKRAKKAEARALRSIIIRWLLDMPDDVFRILAQWHATRERQRRREERKARRAN